MPEPARNSPWSRVSILNLKGELLARWGEEDGSRPGSFYAAHGICIDSRGDLYVSEVPASSTKGQPPTGSHVMQKFARLAPG